MPQREINYPPVTALSSTWKIVSSQYPDAAKLVLPRRIAPPYGYLSPQHYACATLCFMVENYRLLEGDQALTWALLLVQQLIKHEMPTFFVDREFLKAVAESDPPDCTMADIKWPFDAMILAMPLDVMRDFTGGWDFPFIAVAKAVPGEYRLEHPSLKSISSASVDNRIHRFVMHFAGYFADGPPIDYFASHDLKTHISELATETNFTDWTANTLDARVRGAANSIPTPDQKSELELSQKLSALTTKILLAMTSSPQYIERGTRLWPKSAPKPGQVLEKPELHSPNIIGRRVVLPTTRDNSEPSGKTMPAHWRRGHWQWTAIGERAKLVSVAVMKRNKLGAIDWANNPPELVEGFRKSHTIDWILPLKVNES